MTAASLAHLDVPALLAKLGVAPRRITAGSRRVEPGVAFAAYPGLHVEMPKAAKRDGVPVLHSVAPPYWAWGPWSMRRYRRAVDATLTILPFETAFFARFRVPAAYIGPIRGGPRSIARIDASKLACSSRSFSIWLPGASHRLSNSHGSASRS